MADLSRAPLPTLASKAFGRTVGQVTARWRTVPDYLVIGTKRGGTTSLQQYLTAHPDVLEPKAAKASHYFDVNHDKGWSWYRAHFPLQSWMDRQRAAGRPVVVGEASPYYCFHPLALDRIADQLPTVRMMIVLRDPVERAWSHYSYEVARGNEDLSFADAIDAEPERLAGAEARIRSGAAKDDRHWRLHSYLRRGHYEDQIGAVHRLFAPEQLHVVVSEELFAGPLDVMNQVFDFLGVGPVDGGRFDAANANRKSALEPELRERLATYYAPHNQRLYEVLGRELPWTAPAATAR
jgi:Sulfotransferase domain